MTSDVTQQTNYYEVLGANPMDQLDRIEDLFRQLAYEAEQSGDHSQVPLAVEAFKVLRDPAKRNHYDQQLAHQQRSAAAQQSQQVQPVPQVQQGQPQGIAQPLTAEQAQHSNFAAAAPTQYQPTPSQLMPSQQQSAQYQPTPTQLAPAPEQAQADLYQPAPSQMASAPEQAQADLYQPAPSQMAPAPEQAQADLYQPAPSQMVPAPEQAQADQYPPAPSEVAPAPEQAQADQFQGMPSEAAPPEQPVVSVPNVQPASDSAQAVEAVAAPVQAPSATDAEDELEPPEFCPHTAQRRRREVLAMFYKRRRDDAKNPGIAVGGIEQKVDYTYETLEFHLWYMQQREWLLRLESGMFTITYLGVEEHEKNQSEGLIR